VQLQAARPNEFKFSTRFSRIEHEEQDEPGFALRHDRECRDAGRHRQQQRHEERDLGTALRASRVRHAREVRPGGRRADECEHDVDRESGNLVAEQCTDHDRGRAAPDQSEAEVDQRPGTTFVAEVAASAVRVAGAQP
jgi:hypothetical protein